MFPLSLHLLIKKKIGVISIIRNNDEMNETMRRVSNMYKNINEKYPNNFTLDKRYN